ncbi:UbiD family decarboxylase [Desulfonatronovibrio hydrogenovorans]|uniref:UbiD family decarboxylase n=1 Tax=Desulfonatronovibrio hydrogenovorans TaxID=53245 RepID=UPI0004901F68|nr:UbiD family decarboxylase [Desulfonatronovibrio hydrogenovorans]
MGYRNTKQCLDALEARGDLVRIDQEVDPYIEAGAIQRRVFQHKGPALLFTNVKGTGFPMAANMFGTMARARYIFRDTLATLDKLFKLKIDPLLFFKAPWKYFDVLPMLARIWPRPVKSGPIQQGQTRIENLPNLVSWPMDGGAYVTLPQVYSQNPARPGLMNSNIGMYRVQLTGNDFKLNQEVGLHYQIHRGIGLHHQQAIERNEPLRVNVFIGGPPAMTLAAVMPLPENVPELIFAGALAGHRIKMVKAANGLPMPAEADFCISGRVDLNRELLEGPFGDHLGYYSLKHDFPVLRVDQIHHRKDAIWPFTTVGRPPQEDTVFGTLIHELTHQLIPSVFSGVHEVHAVDAAGVHPLLLAVGRESYVPFARERQPQELLTCAMNLLGQSQTSLSKYLIIAAREDDPGLSAKRIPAFFSHVLKRLDFTRDLHFITRTTMDTLDYSGISLNQGSKLIMAAAGRIKRDLGTRLPRDLDLGQGFSRVRFMAPGIMVVQGPGNTRNRDSHDPAMAELGSRLEQVPGMEQFPLVVVADDADFTAAGWNNFLWVVFTRSDPATDIYGIGEFVHCKHFGATKGMLIDARLKQYHPPVLEDDPEVEKRVDRLGERGGPLYRII